MRVYGARECTTVSVVVWYSCYLGWIVEWMTPVFGLSHGGSITKEALTEYRHGRI